MADHLDLEATLVRTSQPVPCCGISPEALHESEQRYRLLVEMIPGIVYRAALDEDGSLLYLSPRIETMLGFGAGEFMDEPGLWLRQVHEEDRERVQAECVRARSKGASLVSEYRMVARSGRIVWLHDEALPVLDAEGRVRFMQGLLQNITERRQAEVEMREWRDEMERLMGVQVAAQTAAALAHELNQPLTAIASYNAAALRLLQAGNPCPERLGHAVGHSAEQVERAGQVMRDLLALLHKGETETEQVLLNAAVLEAVSILKADGYIDGVQAELRLDDALPQVRANRLQVQKVLVNLLRNAVEAIRGTDRPKGIVRVRTAVVEGMARVSVEDDGPGIHAEQLKQVFEPFFTTKREGIGMGLAISQSLIRAHGGKLWAENNHHRGAVFHFTLPLAD